MSRLEADVTILVLTYNGLSLLRNCLDSLKSYDNVIVIDNGSSESVNQVTAEFRNIHETIRLSPNRGFAGAYNMAMQYVKTPYVVLVSNDTIIAPECIERLISELRRDDTVGITAPLILNVDGSIQDTGWLLDVFGFPIECEPRGESWEAFYASGCLLAMPTELYRSIGGFSQHFDFFVEDVDLCWKVRLRGKGIRIIREAVIRHVGGATLDGASTDSRRNVTSIRRTYFRERNVPMAFLQNFSFTQLIWRLPLYMANSLFEAAGTALIGKPGLAVAYAKAWRDCLRLMPEVLKARAVTQKNRSISDAQLTKFFLLRNRKAELISQRGLPSLRG